MNATISPEPQPGEIVTIGENEAIVVLVDHAAGRVKWTDGIAQDGYIPLTDLRRVDSDIDPDGVMGLYALPVGYWQPDRAEIICPRCVAENPGRWSTMEPVYRPSILDEGELCAGLGVFNDPRCHDLEPYVPGSAG